MHTESLLDILSSETEIDREVTALKELTDHELADLGITRDQIELLVLERALDKTKS